MDGCRGASCSAVLSLWNRAASDDGANAANANIVTSAIERNFDAILEFVPSPKFEGMLTNFADFKLVGPIETFRLSSLPLFYSLSSKVPRIFEK